VRQTENARAFAASKGWSVSQGHILRRRRRVRR
jgi:hypothetical protein